MSPAIINREFALMQRGMKHARLVGIDSPQADTEPAIKWKDLKLAEPHERSGDEQRKIFEQFDDDLAAEVEFAILSDQRRGAVIGLPWENVDLGAGRACVHTKGDIWHVFPLTTHDRDHHGTAEAGRLPFVFSYKCQRPSPARKDGAPRRKGVRYPFGAEGWKRQLSAALKAAGIADFRFHDLRHTTATRTIRSSGNLKAAQKLLGHTDIATTARYAHVLEDDLRTIMADTELGNSYGKVSGAPDATATETAENDGVE